MYALKLDDGTLLSLDLENDFRQEAQRVKGDWFRVHGLTTHAAVNGALVHRVRPARGATAASLEGRVPVATLEDPNTVMCIRTACLQKVDGPVNLRRQQLQAAFHCRLRVTFGVAEVCEAQGDFAGALKHLSAARELVESAFPASTSAAAVLEKIGNLQKVMGLHDEAMVLYHAALAINEQQAPGGVEVAATCCSLGNLHLARDKPEAALEWLIKARRGQHVPRDRPAAPAAAAARRSATVADQGAPHQRRALPQQRRGCLHLSGTGERASQLRRLGPCKGGAGASCCDA
jgi:tetratricopeptide (TPR) repeat protein